MSTGPGGGPPDEGDEATFADVLNAFTLDSKRGRRKRKKDREAQPAETQADPAYDGQHAYPAQPGQPPAMPAPPHPGALPPREAPPGPPGFSESSHGTGYFESGVFGPAVNHSGPVEFEDRSEEETSVVRPYALTGGRTKAKITLELETLISVSDVAAASVDPTTVQFEHRAIMEECRTPRSVAEIAALLRVPLGVARVLISDAADAGLVIVHQTVSGNEDAEAHFMLMERVLSGLRRL